MLSENLLHDALALPPADRRALAERLWESLQDEQLVTGLSDVHRSVLDQRLTEMESHPDDELSIEQLEARLRDAR